MKNKMKKLITLSAIVASTIFTGCVNQERIEYPTYKPVEKVDLNKRDIVILKNGKLTYNEKTIMDADGNINFATLIDNKLYYMVSKIQGNQRTYVLKDENSKVIQEFDGARILIMKDVDGLPLILIEKGNNYVYGNVYRFDGKEVKLVNKNIAQYNDEVYMAGYRFERYIQTYPPARLLEYKSIVNVIDNSSKTIKPLRPLYTWEAFPIIASAGSNIVYVYEDINGDSVIETLNLKTNQQKTLLKGDKTKCQLLSLGNKKVLRIFNTPVEEERSRDNAIPTSKYDNVPSVFIDLDTLKEVNININDFEKVILNDSGTGIAGNTTIFNYITFDLKFLKYVAKFKAKGEPLF